MSFNCGENEDGEETRMMEPGRGGVRPDKQANVTILSMPLRQEANRCTDPMQGEIQRETHGDNFTRQNND